MDTFNSYFYQAKNLIMSLNIPKYPNKSIIFNTYKSNLSPHTSFKPFQRRKQYLKMLQGIIRNTEYGGHQHRRDDLLRCFARIFCEEGDTSKEDQTLVRAISNEFPQYFKA